MFSLRFPCAATIALIVVATACRASTQLDLASLGAVATQSSVAGALPSKAIDGNESTASQTLNLTNSFWQMEFTRKVQLSTIELVAPDAGIANNLILRIYDLRDRTIFQARVSGVTADSSGFGRWSTNLPPGIYGRIVRFGLENGETNGDGSLSVALCEVRAYGDPSSTVGPTEMAMAGTATESSTSLSASLAIDGNPGTTSETLDLTNSYWLLTFDNLRAIQRLELVNTTSGANAARLQGLTVRILDNNSNSITSTTVPGVATGGNWIYTPATTVTNARYIKIGLENGNANGQGNHIVSLAEVNVLSTTNFAAGKPSFLTRDTDVMPPNSYANDDSYSTSVITPYSTHDPYWEVDLGKPIALYNIRVVAADGYQADTTHATVSILDENYNEIYSQHLSGSTEVFDVNLPSVFFGRYVRVSLDYAERSRSGSSWYIGLKEVEAFGRPTNEVGLLSFSASPTQIVSGASTTLQWQESDLNELDLYPNYGSVGASTAIGGAGSLALSPAVSTEYTLVGLLYSNNFPRQMTVEVDGQKLPPQISEFVADNQFSMNDGNGNASDWIELHNPNNTPLDVGGYYLSDDPAALTKWRFPSGTTISPHGYFIVFADSASTNHIYDPSNYLHTSFGLDNNGESLILTSSNGVTVLDGITNFPAQTTDLAYGRTLNGQWTFLEPTPFAPNVATNYAGWLAPLDFDHKRGWYTNSFVLVISNSNAGATVYWSTNGCATSNIYTGPLNIANTVGVRAWVTKTNYKSPAIKTHTYLFLNDIVKQTVLNVTYRSSQIYSNRLRQGFLDLPVININVPPPDPKYAYLTYNQDRPERAASVEFFMPDGSNVQQDCGMIQLGGQFGTGTGLYTKKTWQLNFKSSYGANALDFPLFSGFDHGILAHHKFKELDIHAGNQDQGGFSNGRGFYMSHAFALDSMLDMGDLNPHSRFVQLFTNGVYMGQFCMNERLTDAMLAEYLGGSKSDYLTVKGNDNTGAYGFIPGVADGPDRSAYDFVRSNMNSYVTIKDWVDATNLIDYMLMWQWGNAEAEFRAAMPRAAGKGGFKVWLADADGLVRQQSGVSGQLGKNYIYQPSNPVNIVFTWGPGWIFSNLLHEANSDFKTLLADRIYKNYFNNGPMTPTKLQARLDARMAEITNSLVDECARWSSIFTTTFDPNVWASDAQYDRDNLFPQRSDIVVSQMRDAGWYPSFDPPTLSQYGGSVTNGYQLVVTTPVGMTIYYTLDGSDPRLPGGGISPNAIAWMSGQSIVNVVNIPLGSTWRYYNTNSAPPGSWTNRIYDDSAWRTGATPMGYPQPDGVTFSTVLNYGSDSTNKWISYYFRNTFVVTNLDGITNMALGLNRDDGAVIYVNGTELMRDNMPAGPVSYGTFASTAVSGAAETAVFQYNVPANLLVLGTNVIAVEVHQDAVTSSDLHFNLSLAGSVTNNNGPSLVLTLTNATTFNARTWDGTTWSALDSAGFILAPLRQPNPGDLIISELNYHPPDLDNYEFVELYNTTTNQLDLTGVQLTDGITFLFPNGFTVAPNGFALAVKDPATFAARYQTTNSPYYYPNLNVAGPYSGKLSDSGERIALIASNGVELCEVNYQDSGVWPGRADGNGSSLELRDLAAAAATTTNINNYLARAENWKSSSLWGGSPGRFDATQNIVINELVAHTHDGNDWVELKNLNPNPVDVSGLYLSDNYSNVFRYYIPANTIIPGNGFLILNQTNIGFAFSEHGEDVILSKTSGTNIIRYIDTVNYDAVARDESLGRYTRSDGVADFTELRSQTPLAENDLPRVGPVVISEIMYYPATNKFEYIEIANISRTNVLLYDPLAPTNTWILTDAVDFTFPTNQVLAPGAVAIICETNAAAFQSQYSVPTNVTIYGPYSGKLDNAGEQIKLEHPGDRETNGFLPYYRMDHVRYEPDGPWPAQADSGGFSLERVTLEGYGNDPINWQPSATNGSPGTVVDNHQPDLNVVGDTTVYEGDTVSLTASASDVDQPWQTIALSAQNLPGGSSFDPNSGTFLWPTVETDGPGVYNLQFIVADNGNPQMATTQAVVVTVLESNLPPWLQTVTNILYPAQIPFTLDLMATDADWPPNILTYSASGLPSGLSLNPSNGHIGGSAKSVGVFLVSYSVSDNGTPSQSASNSFILTISQPFIATATTINAATKFAFRAIAGQNYDVQYSQTLSPPNWQLLRHITNAPGGLISITNAPSTNQCFIRVIWNR